jgi:putative membrane protein
MYAGVTFTDWALEPAIVAPLLLAAAWYVAGVRALWSGHERRVVDSREVASFAVGCGVVAIALLSPLHEASERLFSAHMIQHELLMVVAAPLLILGRPAVVMLWAIPPRGRVRVGRVVSTPAWRTLWHAVSRPMNAWLIHAIVIWGWHLPVLFQAALRSDATHTLQHLSFVGSALLFWWAIFHPRRQAALGLSVLYLFTTAVHTAVLGALITFARAPWYPAYVAPGLGLGPLEDQQLAGLVMWIPASLAYLIAALVIVRRWLRESEGRVARAEAAVASA